MNEVYKIYLSQIDKAAQALTPLPLQQLLVPAMILLSVFLASFVCVWFRLNARQFARVNLGLMMISLALFQACSNRGVETSQSNTAGVSSATPVAPVDSVPTYFRNRVTVMKHRSHKNANSPSAEFSSSTVPECVQYNIAIGNKANATSYSCNFISDWDGSNGVRAKLQGCTAASQKYLLLDQVYDFTRSNLYQTDLETPLLRVETATPFLVLAYCVDVTNKTVDVFNPEHISLQARAPTENTFSIVEKMIESPGWFKGGFLALENGAISSKYSIVEMDYMQGDVDIRTLMGGRIPKLRVQVDPPSWTAWDPQFNMGRFVTDNMQTMLRDPVFQGPVNVANGEFYVSHVDAAIPLSDHDGNLLPARTYRSNYSAVGDFGYFWDLFPRKQYLSFASPIGEEGAHPFLYPGNAQLLYIPDYSKVGIFWGVDPNDSSSNPRPNPLKPDFQKTRYLPGLDRSSSFDLNGRLIALQNYTNQNLIFYIRDGSNVLVAMDMIGARNAKANQTRILNAYKLASAQYAAGQYIAAWSILNNQTTGTIPVQGNFLFFVRNARGYITWIFDKAGNATEFRYQTAKPDLLESVWRHASHDPDGNGVLEYESIQLYSYTYSPPVSGLDPTTWPALLSGFSTFARTNEVTSVKYILPDNRFGEAPVVSEITTPIGKYTYAYDFKTLQSTAPSVTTVTDPLGRSQYFSFDWRGFVKKIEGPTASSPRQTLAERLLDPHSLRIVNQTSLGGEVLSPTDDQGYPEYIETCADRNAGSQSRITPVIGTIDNDGNPSGIQCEGTASRRTNYFHDFYQNDWYVDLSGSLIARRWKLPDSDLIPGTNREFQAAENNCYGAPGRFTYSPTGAGDGTTCAFAWDSESGGSWVKPGLQTSHENGYFKTYFDGWAPQGAPGYLGGTLAADRTMAQQNASQIGRFTRLPATGFTQEQGGDGQQMLNAYKLRLFDIYNNPMIEKHPFGARTYFYYNYLLPRAVVSARSQTKLAGSQLGSIPTTLPEVDVYNNLANGITSSGNNSLMRSRVTGLLNQTKGLNLWPYFLGYLSTSSPRHPLRPDWVFDGNSLKFYSYKPGSLLVTQITSRQAKNDTFESLDLVTTFDYDAFERPTKVTKPDGTYIQTDYRSANDKGIQRSISNQASINGVSTTSEVLTRDWADRPLTVRLTRSIPNDSHGNPVSSAPSQVTTTYEYEPFGEVSKEIKALGSGQSTTTIYERELSSGAITRVTKQYSGNRMPPNDDVFEFSEFNTSLRPLKKTDVSRNLVTLSCNSNGTQTCANYPYSATPGYDEVTEVWGPSTYRASNSNILYSKQQSIMDGCGNVKYSRKWDTDSTYFESQTNVLYDQGLCLPNYSQDEYGWRTYFGYGSAGEQIFSDASFDADQPTRPDNRINNINHERPITANGGYLEFDGNVGTNGRPNLFDVRDPSAVKAPVMVSVSIEASCGRTDSSSSRDCSGTSRDPFVINSGSFSWLNSGGQKVYSVQYAKESQYPSYDRVISWNRTDTEQAFSSSRTERNEQGFLSWQKQYDASGLLQGFVQSENDRIAGKATRLERRTKEFETGTEKAMLQLAQLDELGNVTGSSVYEADLAIASGTGDWRPGPSALKTQVNVNNWSANRPVLTTTTNWTPGGTIYDFTSNDQFGSSGTFEMPTRTVFTRTMNLESRGTGTRTTTYDGIQRPSTVTFVDEPAPAAKLVSLTSQVNSTYDLLGRITYQDVSLSDNFSGSVPAADQVYQVGSYNLQRRRFTSPQGFSVSYEYPDAETMIMRFDGFTVTYTVSAVTGQILKTHVRPPVGSSWTYLTQEHLWKDDATYAFLMNGNVDFAQGQITDTAGRPILNVDLYQSGAGTYTINNQSSPRYWFHNYGSSVDDFFRTFVAEFTGKGSILSFRPISGGNDAWPSEFRNLRASSDGSYHADIFADAVLPKLRSQRQSNSAYTCDNIAIRKLTNRQDQPEEYTSSYFASQGNNFNGQDDRVTMFNELGKVSRIRRAVYHNPIGGTAKTRRWFTESTYSYDVNGQPARSEEVLWYQNSAASGSYYRTQAKVARAIIRNRFFVSLPNPDAFGGTTNFPLKEMIVDPGAARSRLANQGEGTIDGCLSTGSVACADTDYLCDCRFGSGPVVNGNVYHIPGPNGVIMTMVLREETPGNWVWKAFQHIKDGFGNVAVVRNEDNLSEGLGSHREMYLPFLTSITARYNNLRVAGGGYPPDAFLQVDDAPGAGYLYRYSLDPEFFPRFIGYGPAGEMRDINGIVTLNGQAYSSVEGNLLYEGFQDGPEICRTGSSALMQAQANFSKAFMREYHRNPNYQVSSIKKRVEEAQAYIDYLEAHPIRRFFLNAIPKTSAESFFTSRGTMEIMQDSVDDLSNSPIFEAVDDSPLALLGVTSCISAAAMGGPGKAAFSCAGMIPVGGWIWNGAMIAGGITSEIFDY